MSQTDKPNPRYLGVQLSPEQDDRLTELAEYHGRSKAEEARRALAIFDVASTLAYLQTPEGELELGDDLERAKEDAQQQLHELIAATTRPALSPYRASLN